MRTDLISRSAVLDRLEMLRRNYTLKAGYRDAMTDAIGEVRGTPAIDAVPVVHARWIYSGDMDLDGNSQGYCSRCGAGDKHRADLKNLVPYCWKCGARMDGERYE